VIHGDHRNAERTTVTILHMAKQCLIKLPGRTAQNRKCETWTWMSSLKDTLDRKTVWRYFEEVQSSLEKRTVVVVSVSIANSNKHGLRNQVAGSTWTRVMSYRSFVGDNRTQTGIYT
jgi:hypothetical protein